MASSPPASPGNLPPRPMSAMVRPTPRSNSRLSMTSKGGGGGSRASDEDGRTSVKVVVRVRPPLQPTDPGFDLIPQRWQETKVHVTSSTSLAIDNNHNQQGRKLFVFDRVFGPDINQQGIWEYLADCVNAFTQGYNVSLLAYGQSGAGKSYTMGTSGPAEQGDLEVMGVIPRAAMALFEKLEGPTPKGNPNRNSMSHLRTPARYSAQPSSISKSHKDWTLKATYVEIYNEQLRDLLIPEHTPANERSQVMIREDTKGNILLTGLRQVEINSVDDLMAALNFGSTLRQTDATAINARSSRSHAVFSLNLVQRKSGLQSAQGAEKRFSVPLEAMTGSDAAWVTIDSKLHFVDLAGSERLKNTGAQGERAKEGISINAGLAALGKVISQLSSRQPGSHVSYRDSKLTRLLQDSLGGNAITYMIACVTPAEFHLSETLNTVQYAQRARAIQSKPRIQQVEEGDKQAIIERLKAEVAFLREQIRSAERGGGDRRTVTTSERSERQNEREVELQNQLLDAQENYSALSQRHAKVIAEMLRARDNELAENQQLEETLGDSATERLNRSNSFAEAVQQVVLEYEKTIQTMEQSLSNTRSTLSSTEASLLEKETKCAYVETINTQLSARLQKLMDREASTENYLHDLEAKLDGHTSGEEKNATIILELRKEIARVRENEASCEDYISTLEERLAEADQDAELMQREIDRLEQVIERQRSLGKLDSLLYELDHIQQDSPQPEGESEPQTNGIGHRHRRTASRNIAIHSRTQSHVSRHSAKEDAIPEIGEEDIQETIVEEEQPVAPTADEPGASEESTTQTPQSLDVEKAAEGTEYPGSPAQSKFVADKLENVTQELIDLRVEHESTVTEYDLLHAKYEEALRALAELQDTIDEARHPHRIRDSILSVTSPTDTQTRPSSFLSEPRSADLKDTQQRSSSRSLSSELSSALESPATMEISDAETAVPKTKDEKQALVEAAKPASREKADQPPEEPQDTAQQSSASEECRPASVGSEAISNAKHPDELETEPEGAAEVKYDSGNNGLLQGEIQRLKALALEKETAEKELAEKYAELESKHHEALDMVEELKTEVAKAQAQEVTSPRASMTPVIRRKSSQNVMTVDRAHRSFASLKNIASENFEDQPDVRQNFELNLQAAMHELYARSERIQELEADVASAKKEMETKMAIISGLTRERSSLKASPVDISVVSNLRDQLEKNERQLKEIQDAHATRERELQAELESLRKSMEAPKPEEAAKEATATESVTSENREEQERKIAELEAELASWENKHSSTLESMQSTEEQMKKTIAELEAQLANANAHLANPTGATDEDDEEAKQAATKQENLVNFLRSEIDEYKAIINSNATKVAELEQTHASTKSELEDAQKARELASSEIDTHKQLVARLESQIVEHEQAIKAHQDGVELLKATHTKEVEEIKAASKQEYDAQLQLLMAEHAENIKILESDLTECREDLMKVATQVAFALGLDVSVEKLSERIEDLIADQKALGREQKKNADLHRTVAELSNINDTVMRDLEAVKSTLTEMLVADGHQLRSPYPSVSEQLAMLKKKMVDLETKNKKHSRLVDELEEQLQTNFDEAQRTNNRLSTLQTERNVQLDEANAAKVKLQSELDSIKEEYASLQAKFEGIIPADGMQRSNSMNSQLRKSGSVSSLPSPPPAIPLPPLPRVGSTSPPNAGGVPATPTGVRTSSKELSLAQIHEDQEARIKTIEKHLDAEKQLTATLEEALTDLEKQSNKVKADCDAWRRRCNEMEAELKEFKEKPQQDNRWSLHEVEEERKKRRDAEIARAHLEERMNAINNKSKKKKSSLNCF
ncbi:Kinesin family protein [Pleurostoma richardsiae]|uniref:Kinesin family protein n=1 Tax=Pleurostoma richardsiae TaxID=41990 RepID=A0AA38RFA9_9PEZI|nr:Kinesin family protein [Pleurostoma richardsiae]